MADAALGLGWAGWECGADGWLCFHILTVNAPPSSELTRVSALLGCSPAPLPRHSLGTLVVKEEWGLILAHHVSSPVYVCDLSSKYFLCSSISRLLKLKTRRKELISVLSIKLGVGGQRETGTTST